VSLAPIFQELTFRSGLRVKNRVFRSSISGRFDNYDGSGTHARISWEEKFARGGVGAIISSFVPVHVRGRIMPNYAMIDRDEHVPFWRAVGERVHAHGCKFILQLSHSGRQQDLAGVENAPFPALSSTGKKEPIHGFLCRAMTREEIRHTVGCFAAGARRARDAGLDGVELHASNGYLFTQFLSSAINDRRDEYGGPLENRYRFLQEVVQAVRGEAGPDYHLQVKISAEEYNNAVVPWPFQRRGNTIKDSVQVATWLERDGADAIHVSCGSSFPHPRNPPGDLPMRHAARYYDGLVSGGVHAHRNQFFFHRPWLWPLFRFFWGRKKGRVIEGINLPEARAIKQAVGIPVLCTGGFQTGSLIAGAIARGDCDAVAIARPLIANNDLVRRFERGEEVPERLRCTYCNKCLLNDLESPLACYELSRFGGDYDAMIREAMSVYSPGPFQEAAP
jgi:2,4-dienoyl-CoA reductase (NADPH2)